MIESDITDARIRLKLVYDHLIFYLDANRAVGPETAGALADILADVDGRIGDAVDDLVKAGGLTEHTKQMEDKVDE